MSLGEDRWLCTLLLRRGYRVEYCAAADAMTFAPERFSEFFNQRRRWIPSTLANTIEILSNWKIFIQNNDNISFLYIAYQALLLVISFVSPGTIFLLIVGAINKAYPSITLSTSFFLNFLPLLIMMILCKYASTEKQVSNRYLQLVCREFAERMYKKADGIKRRIASQWHFYLAVHTPDILGCVCIVTVIDPESGSGEQSSDLRSLSHLYPWKEYDFISFSVCVK